MWVIDVYTWGDLFTGRGQDHYCNNVYRPVPSDYERWLSILLMSETAEFVLKETESASNFFDIEKDLALLVPEEQRTEFFYSLKNGFVAPNCPAQFIYFARVCYAKYKICNTIGPLLPRILTRYLTAKDYFGAGYTARDAICNFVNADYQPITESAPIVRCGSWYEAYLPELGTVVALPKDIGGRLSQQDVSKISLTPGVGLTLEGHPLAALGTDIGERGIYDLRRSV